MQQVIREKVPVKREGIVHSMFNFIAESSKHHSKSMKKNESSLPNLPLQQWTLLLADELVFSQKQRNHPPLPMLNSMEWLNPWLSPGNWKKKEKKGYQKWNHNSNHHLCLTRVIWYHNGEKNCNICGAIVSEQNKFAAKVLQIIIVLHLWIRIKIDAFGWEFPKMYTNQWA